MLRFFVFALSLVLVAAILVPSQAFADKEMFLENKCNKCHSISALEIKSEKEQKAEAAGETVKDPAADLSDVGKYHDAAFFKEFLKRKVVHKLHDDTEGTKKHKKKFKGPDEDLDKLVQWLTALK